MFCHLTCEIDVDGSLHLAPREHQQVEDVAQHATRRYRGHDDVVGHVLHVDDVRDRIRAVACHVADLHQMA